MQVTSIFFFLTMIFTLPPLIPPPKKNDTQYFSGLVSSLSIYVSKAVKLASVL